MEYKDFEQLFIEEQKDLDRELKLEPLAIQEGSLSRDIWHLKMGKISHQVGGAVGICFLITTVVFAIDYSAIPALSIPFGLAAFALALNTMANPIKNLPTYELDQYTTTELARKIRSWRLYASRRLFGDSIAVGIFLIAFLNWYVYQVDGFVPFQNPALLSLSFIGRSLSLFVFAVFGGIYMTKISNDQLKKIEQRLDSYLEQELV